MSHEDLIRRAEARVGTTLKKKWTVDTLLGVGGMAVVYAATHRNKKRVAIKMLHPELSIDSNIKARFLREGYVANTVDHPGVVRVDDDDVAEDGAAFIVMELLEGETLQARVDRKGGRLPVDEVLSIADQLLDVLAAAHNKGIVHRDLKPENLFLDKTGQVKVLDFGIARLRDGKQRPGTQTGALMGTPSFMPPEQARGRWDEVDARSDLWAVGATMYTLLTARLVHEAETANEALAFAVTQRAPRIESVMPEVSAGVAALIDRALSYEMDARYPDAASMQNAVREAYAALHDAPASERVPALSMPNVMGFADMLALPSLTPAVDASGAVKAVSPTDVGVTRSAPSTPAKKLFGGPVAIGTGVVFVLLVGIAVVVLAVHSHSTRAAAAASAPAASALAQKLPKASVAPRVAPATSQPPDDQAAVNVEDLPEAVQKKKPKAVSTHHTIAHKAVVRHKPKPEAIAKPEPPAPTVSDDPFAKRR